MNNNVLENVAKDKNLKVLEKEIYSEQDLFELVESLQSEERIQFAKEIIDYILNNQINRNFDWNVGSILQHIDARSVVNILKKVNSDKRSYLYDMIGIIWVLGEFEFKDQFVIELLHDAIKHTRNPEVWWRAAFSLEKITDDNAVNLLKRNLKERGTRDLNYYLDNLNDKRSVIGVLLYANNKQIKEVIYNNLKEQFEQRNEATFLNVVWLLGRLRLFNRDTFEQIKEILETTDDYENIYYIFWAMQENPTSIFLNQFEKYSTHTDPLIRRMAVRGIGEIGEEKSVDMLETMLEVEQDSLVIGEITKSLYKIKNAKMKWKRTLKNRYIVNENGLIGDDSDKWYADPSIYNIFSESEDVENVCFNLVTRKLKQDGVEMNNPVDLATGTGRMLKLILNSGEYNGTLYGVDLSKEMLEYLGKTIDRQKGYVYDVQLLNSSIEDLKLPDKSSFIISSFGFPSKMSNKEKCINELKAVYNNLSDNGVFVTIGWDETFNDELNEMWYKYIPDDIVADSFEEWRMKRAAIMTSPRNCKLKWLKTNMNIPLQYTSIEESVNVMGHLFGRDAANDVLNSRQKEWWMSMGITYNTKKEIEKIIREMEQ